MINGNRLITCSINNKGVDVDRHEENRIKKLVIERSRQSATFKKKIIELGKMAHQAFWGTRSDILNYKFIPHVIEIASEIDILDKPNQALINDLIDLFSSEACIFAYIVKENKRLPPGPLHKTPLGYVFFSWSVNFPRDLEVSTGIKIALDWFNIEYFDFCGNEDLLYMTESQAEARIAKEVAKSQVCIEIVSSENASSRWIQFERHLISKKDNIWRILVCLEWEKAHFFQMPEKQESRSTRIDISNGRHSVISTKNFEQLVTEAGETSYYSSPSYYFQCYEIAALARRLLTNEKHNSFFGFIKSSFEDIRRHASHDSSNFVATCLLNGEVELQLQEISRNPHYRKARIDDLFFVVPDRWSHVKKKTGYWMFWPIPFNQSIFIRVRFFNVGQEGMGTPSELSCEIKKKAQQRNWKLWHLRTQKIENKFEAVDALAEAKSGVTHRFIDFYYNGLEYFIEIRTNTKQHYDTMEAIFNIWIDSFHLRSE